MKASLVILFSAGFLVQVLASPRPEVTTKTVDVVQTPLPSYQDAYQGYLAKIARLVTSPKHAWWSNILRESSPPTKSMNRVRVKRDELNLNPSNPAVDATIIFTYTSTIVPTPTFCSYLPSTSSCNTGCICSTSCTSIYITNYTLLEAALSNWTNTITAPIYHVRKLTAWISNQCLVFDLWNARFKCQLNSD